MEAARRASLLDEEARKMRDHELADVAFRSRLEDTQRSTSDGVDIAMDTTDGVPTTYGAGSWKPNLRACLSSVL